MAILRMILCCIVFAAAGRAEEQAPIPIRTWTSVTGRTLDARFTKEAYGTIFLETAAGRTIKIRVTQLSQADRDYVRQQKRGSQSTTADAKDESAENDSIFAGLLNNHLVKAKGKKVRPYQMSTNPDYYAFYYSASWCGPCHRFTPDLVKFYKRSKGLAEFCEVILVTSDRSEAAMQAYMTKAKMPWPALAYDKARSRDVQRYAGRGIPCLVLVDKNGKVISDSYVGGQYVGPTKVMLELKSLFKREGKKSRG